VTGATYLVLFIRHEGDQVNEAEIGNHVKRMEDRCKMTNRCIKELVDFINVFQILPRHASASGCHLQGVVGA
jgi:hypothetical protein